MYISRISKINLKYGECMIVVLGGIKGGSGKTTLATNLTVIRASLGFKVLLIDGDDQRSSSDWADQRESLGIDTPWTTIQLTGKSSHSQIEKMVKNYDDIIVDIGGRDTTTQRSILTVADFFVIPFKPRSLDIWTMGPVKNLINEVSSINRRLKSFAVINQGDVQGSDNSHALEILSECSDMQCISTFIGHRKAFSNAAANGLGVIELRPADKKAIQEIQALHDVIYK